MNTNVNTTQRPRMNTRMLTMVPLLTVVSYLLAFLEMSLPIIPSFIKLDISDVPALMGAFALGPVAGVMIELLKNLLGLLTTSTAGVGELSNFVLNGSFVAVAGFLYSKEKTRKRAIIACIIAVLVRGVMSIFTNYYVMFPIYEQFMPLDELIGAFSEFVSFIDSKWDIMLYSIFPFNLLKGAVNCIVTIIIYKKLSPVIKGIEERSKN